MTFDPNKTGLFRANPDARSSNNIRVGNADTPGTPGKDSGTADGATFALATGVVYTGLDGVSTTYNFFREDSLTAERYPVSIPTTATGAEFQEVLHRLIGSHEVDPIVSVTKAATVFTIEHLGSGTLSAIVTDTGNIALTRGAAAFVVGAEPAPANDGTVDVPPAPPAANTPPAPAAVPTPPAPGDVQAV